MFAICYSNVSCQKFLLPELNFFLDLINHGIETGMLISEVIKCNRDPVYSKDFIKYLINKIFKEGYFKSTLFKQLIRMAEHNTFLKEEEPDDDNAKAHRPERPAAGEQQPAVHTQAGHRLPQV